MLLWLDDRRDPEYFGFHGWTWVKTADEAIATLQYAIVEKVSLDHDLGRNEPTGYTVMEFLEQHPEFYPKGGVRLHTMNPVGAMRMFAIVKRMEPERNYQTIMQVWTRLRVDDEHIG